MKRALVVVLVLVPGCFFQARGTLGGEASGDATMPTSNSPEGGFDMGVYGADEQQAGGAFLGIESSPLVAGTGAKDAPRVPLFGFGGRYEHAFSARHPGIRGYGQLFLGINLCSPTPNQSKADDQSCKSAGIQRDVVMSSLALGVAFTRNMDTIERALVPSVLTGSLGLKYTYVNDAALGVGDFVGLEASVLFGGDLFTALEDSGHH